MEGREKKKEKQKRQSRATIVMRFELSLYNESEPTAERKGNTLCIFRRYSSEPMTGIYVGSIANRRFVDLARDPNDKSDADSLALTGPFAPPRRLPRTHTATRPHDHTTTRPHDHTPTHPQARNGRCRPLSRCFFGDAKQGPL
jgi:hypothetical protein